ncbi:MAG: insulinase family protein, partial [Alphaproteobacteria bacterium]|nr:insulinase family protein [Alphaproteobacteria bacterium]
ETAGISHFLEHMLAADTTRMTVEENAEHLQLMRGTSNASTGQELTDFYYHLGNEHAGEAVRMLADNVLRATLTPERIENERGSIMQEFLGDADDTDQHMWQGIHQIAFPNTGLDKPIDGSKKQISKRTREELIAFRYEHYTGDKMVLTVVGDIDHDQIVKEAREHFADLKKGTAPDAPRESRKMSEYRGGMRATYDKHAEQTDLIMAFESSGSGDAQNNLLDSVIANILAGSFSSRLFKSLRNDTGLVYSVNADTQHYEGNGILTISTSTTAKDTQQTMDLLCKELRDFPASVTQKELEHSKAELIGGIERSMGDLESIGDNLGDAVMNKDPDTSLTKTISRLQSLTLEEVQARAAKVLSSAPTIMASGNKAHKMPPYEEITRKLGQERHVDASGLVAEKLPSADRSLRGAIVAGTQKLRQHERA